MMLKVMTTRALVAAALALATCAATAGVALGAEPAIPPLTGPVVDTAGLLDAQARQRLESLSRAARAEQGGEGVQLQYLIIPSLEGTPIEDYSIRVGEAWKIGSKGRDNGVLVVVAVKDRDVRIEVGGGIEGGLTDAQSGRIIRNTIVPAFRASRYGEGLYAAGTQILGALGALPTGVAARPMPNGEVGPVAIKAFQAIFFIGLFVLFFIIRIFSGFGRRRRRSLWWWGPGIGGGGWGSGGRWGGGGGGGGGGSWGGGGGGFSGGGASGRW